MKLEERKGIAEFALSEASKAGASYAEVRLHATSGRGLFLKNGSPEPSAYGESLGLGIRVLCKGALGFSATNALDRTTVRELSKQTIKMAKASAAQMEEPIVFDSSRPAKKRWAASEKRPVEDANFEWLRGNLSEVDTRISGSKSGVSIPGRFMALSVGTEEKYYLNTDGAAVQSRVARVGFFASLTAVEAGQSLQRTVQLGESGGLEVAERLKLAETVEEEARVMARVMKSSSKPPTDVVDVVLSSELSGIAAHESVGHPQEADRVLGREGAQAGESYLKADSLGRKVGSPEANVSDDPTLARSSGYFLVDDEGVAAKKRELIKKGVINEFLHNRYTAKQFGLLSNGASRSVGFDREPIVRMSNTFVEPGDYSFDELVKEVKHGIYFKSFTEWNIDDKRLNQRYVALEAYSVENGEVRGLIRAPVLEITTPKLWGSVKARSKNLRFENATCGKGDPMQGAPVWTGGPETLLSGIRLGSR